MREGAVELGPGAGSSGVREPLARPVLVQTAASAQLHTCVGQILFSIPGKDAHGTVRSLTVYLNLDLVRIPTPLLGTI